MNIKKWSLVCLLVSSNVFLLTACYAPISQGQSGLTSEQIVDQVFMGIKELAAGTKSAADIKPAFDALDAAQLKSLAQRSSGELNVLHYLSQALACPEVASMYDALLKAVDPDLMLALLNAQAAGKTPHAILRDPNRPAGRPGDKVIHPVQAAKRARAEPCVRLEPDER